MNSEKTSKEVMVIGVLLCIILVISGLSYNSTLQLNKSIKDTNEDVDSLSKNFEGVDARLANIETLLGAEPVVPVVPDEPATLSVVRFAIKLDPLSIDPQRTPSTVGGSVTQANHDPLIYAKYNYDTGQIDYLPALAVSWEPYNDTFWQFNLRKGVKFSDGTDFDAYAVKATFDRCADPEFGAIASYLLDPIPKWEVVDDYTFRIGGDAPYSAMIQQIALSELGILSPTQLDKTYGDDYTNSPVGTGPFVFKERVLGEKIVYVKNPDYWGKDIYPVNIDQLIWIPIVDDETRLAALEAGDVDVIVAVPPQAVERLRNDGFKVVSIPGARAHMHAMNVRKAPLNDVKVRNAINYAVNKVEIANEIFMGTATPLYAPISPSVWGYVENKVYAYDPVKAEQLLDEAGYPRKADGWRFELEFVVPTGRYMMGKENAEAVSGYLEKVGIKIDLQIVEFTTWAQRGATWTASVWAGDIEYGDFDIAYSSWSTMTLDVDYGVYGNHKTDGYWNRATYSNLELDELMELGSAEFDMDKRFEIYTEVQRIIMEESPHIYTVTQPTIIAMRADLFGIQGLPNDYFYAADAYYK